MSTRQLDYHRLRPVVVFSIQDGTDVFGSADRNPDMAADVAGYCSDAAARKDVFSVTKVTKAVLKLHFQRRRPLRKPIHF